MLNSAAVSPEVASSAHRISRPYSTHRRAGCVHDTGASPSLRVGCPSNRGRSKVNDTEATLVVEIGNEIVALPLPRAGQLGEGTFTMPTTHSALWSAREALIDRYADYWLGTDAELAEAVLHH